jgi:hypothetical protein
MAPPLCEADEMTVGSCGRPANLLPPPHGGQPAQDGGRSAGIVFFIRKKLPNPAGGGKNST